MQQQQQQQSHSWDDPSDICRVTMDARSALEGQVEIELSSPG